jgi:hypothetical protein
VLDRDWDGDRLVAGLGVGGDDPARCADLARAVLAP